MIHNHEEHQRRVVRLLETMQRDASAIYLLGDIFDYWYESFWPNERHFSRYQLVLDALQEAAHHCPVHFFVGNHDMWTFGWLARRTGVQVHYHPEVHTLAGKRFFLAHGDGLGDSEWRVRALNAVFRQPVVQQLYRLIPPALGDVMGYAWSTHSRQKELDNPCPYQGEQNETLLRFAKSYTEQPVDCFVFGHRHIELAFMLPSRACVYILGDFFRQFTYGQLDENGVFSIEQQEE